MNVSNIFRAAVMALASVTGCATPDEQPKLKDSLQSILDDRIESARHVQGLALKGYLDSIVRDFGPFAVEPVRERLYASEEPRHRGSAVYVLGEIYRQDRVTEALLLVKDALDDPDDGVQMEAARALLEVGDRSGARRLVEGLDDPDRGVRIRAFEALRAAAGQDFGYDPDAGAAERWPAIDRFCLHYDLAGGGA